MDYKEKYTKQEIEELIGWFKEHEHELPQTLQIDKATFTPDLQRTVHILLEQGLMYVENPTFYGTIRMLFLIKSKLEEQK